MKRIVLLLAVVIGGIALAQFTPPDDGVGGGITETCVVYGTASDGTGIVTNTFEFVGGRCVDFP